MTISPSLSSTSVGSTPVALTRERGFPLLSVPRTCTLNGFPGSFGTVAKNTPLPAEVSAGDSSVVPPESRRWTLVRLAASISSSSSTPRRSVSPAGRVCPFRERIVLYTYMYTCVLHRRLQLYTITTIIQKNFGMKIVLDGYVHFKIVYSKIFYILYNIQCIK